MLSAPMAWSASGKVPPHLRDYSGLYQNDPRAASLQWFKKAKFGLFMHYGLYSQLGRGEWVMLREKIPLTQYELLQKSFNPSKFNADEITDCAIAAGMKYVNLTSKHHEGFCLFRTAQTNYSSVASPAKRDLVGELAEACHSKGLGLFLYYSAGADWHHPYFCDPSAGWEFFRPGYAERPAQYKWRKDSDTSIYIDYVRRQLRELLTQYGPIAGIWFDPVMGYYARPDLFPMDEIYQEIRSLQPACLVSFKQGATGGEDFAAPERQAAKIGVHDSVLLERRKMGAETAKHAWMSNRLKPMEICDTFQEGKWGYNKSEDGKHRGRKEVLAMLAAAREKNANLLLNTGPLPDGSLPEEDRETLRSLRSI
ncbi:MAG: alpha-L-fucosidase [Acidobacteria bacterium]|nr:alpha-L-fucosidase [Acidobacteriota bacterium]